ncbi:helix-turn-helix domain-containing protein [Agromyces soli]
MTDPTRGALYPSRLPTFTRLRPSPGTAAAELVEWYWIPEWSLPAGETSVQRLLGYPASNLVIEGGAAMLSGPTTRAGERVLVDRGWAVGALLRPAGLAALAGVSELAAEPRRVVDGIAPLHAPELVARVEAAMAERDHDAAVAAMDSWLAERAGEPRVEARLANRMVELIATDSEILRLDDLAVRLAVSPRTLQRLAHRYVGLPPAAMIRRRRLQEAAQRLREDPNASLAALAAELGYADQAHLANDFRDVLGMTATDYRSEH